MKFFLQVLTDVQLRLLIGGHISSSLLISEIAHRGHCFCQYVDLTRVVKIVQKSVANQADLFSLANWPALAG